MDGQEKLLDYETIKAAVAGEKWATEKVLAHYADYIDELSTVKCIIPHTSNSFFLVLAAAFFGLVACLLSASCLRIDGRGLRILTSRRSSLLIMAYTPCRSFMLVKHRDL